MILKAKNSLIFFSICLLVIISNDVIAQTRSRERTQEQNRPLRFSRDTELDQDRLQSQNALQMELQLQPLEGAIDPDTYIVGAGDVFLVTISSAEEINFRVPVIAEGKIVIPTIGILDVEGKKLAEAQTMIHRAAAEKYLESAVMANLVFLRKIIVHVTGQVVNPGSYEALAVDRVSNALEKAGGLTSVGSERAIEVRHTDGTTDVVDFYRYTNLGELDANKYLRGGDVIYVPHINLSGETVRVEGAIDNPGIYQLVGNETLEEFLLRVGAYNRRSDLSQAYVMRKSISNGHSREVPLFPYLESQNGQDKFHLQDNDVVLIPQREEKVYVVGAVRAPGPYDYYPNLQATAYVGFAGSTEWAAKLSKIKVIRPGESKQLKGQNYVIEPGDTIFVPRKAEFGLREITTVIGTITSILLTMKAIDVI